MRIYEKGCLCALGAFLLSASCDSEVAKKATAGAVKAVVRAGKGAAAGMKEGAEEGRKTSVSADGAQVVTKYDELAKAGSLTIWSIAADGKNTKVEFAIENKLETPLRVSGIKLLGLDKENFAIQPLQGHTLETTVPSKAKVMRSTVLQCTPEKLAKIRVGKHEMLAKAQKK